MALPASFDFTIERTDKGPADAVTMPADTTVTTGQIKGGSAALVWFEDITFNTAGTYSFSVTETDSGISGMVYVSQQSINVEITEVKKL